MGRGRKWLWPTFRQHEEIRPEGLGKIMKICQFNPSLGHEVGVTFKMKIQQDATMYQTLLFHIYIKLNMFRATNRPSSGA
jgi:hypothetical protein